MHRQSTAPAGNCAAALEPLEPRLLLSGTDPYISEFMAVNDTALADGDGEYSDWIEIHNPSGVELDLAGWHLTDSATNLTKWELPATTIAPRGYLVVFASGKDRAVAGAELHTDFKLSGAGEYLALTDRAGAAVHEYAPEYPEQVADISYGVEPGELQEQPLVAEDAALKVLVPDGDLQLTWTEPAFDDSLWAGGTSGVGYDTGLTFDSLINTDVEDQMHNLQTTAYIRSAFDLADPSRLDKLTLSMKYDDGYVAYLNGVRIAGENDPASPNWQSFATNLHDDTEAVVFEDVDVTAYLSALQEGQNVLAIHGLNRSLTSADFLIVPKLTGYEATNEKVPQYFAEPTPGAANHPGAAGVLVDTYFSIDRGLFDAPFDVEITTADPEAEIRYTTDGSTPTATHGLVYSGPIDISRTTTLRAAAFRPGFQPTNVDTQTYVFPGSVVSQSSRPAGFPSSWGAEPADYQMNPAITGSPAYSGLLDDALRSIPTMSLVMEVDDLFGPATGIYSNPTGLGVAWERPGSIEYFDPNSTDDFQLDAGVRIYGGVGRQPRFKKHTFRLLFKSEYGATKLQFPLFGDGAEDEFDTLILRSNFNDAWVWGGADTQFVRDEYAARLQLAMGDPSRHGTFVHLYVNGLYWGLYNPVERPDTSFSASYFGGDKANWDGINSGQPTGESQMTAWNELMSQAAGLASNENYQKVQGNDPDGTDNPAWQDYLDIDNYINYILVNQWGGNNDWTSHNWYAGRERGDDSTGFKSYSWDAEWIVDMHSGLHDNSVGDGGGSNWLLTPYTYLRGNAEFRMRYADHVHRHFFNGGVLTPEHTIPLYQSLADEIELAVITEAARWGDVAGSYGPGDWIAERDYILDTYLPQRTGIVLTQLIGAGLYPDVVAPSFGVNGSYRHGGAVQAGDQLTIGAPAGTIYYTMDGSDPRLYGGGINPNALIFGPAVGLQKSELVRARVYDGGEWSALNEAEFHVIDDVPALRITEMMFNPAAPSAAEIAAGFDNNENFEFIELRNVGTQSIYLGGMSFTDGVTMVLPRTYLQVGEYTVAARSPEAFAFRHGAESAAIAGEYSGSLDNGGERVALETAFGSPIQQFVYDDWYTGTDGEGYSLTIRDESGSLDLWSDPLGWRGSELVGGSPGGPDNGLPLGSIAVNEILAHSDSGVGDWIELLNTTDQDIDVGGWFLSDSDADLTKYQIAEATILSPGEFLVLDQLNHFGIGSTDPGSRVGFGLSELGEQVCLSSNAGGVPGGFREAVEFGASPKERTIGRHVRSTGEADMTLLTAATKGRANAAPFVGPLVINEVMYDPAAPPGGSFAPERYEFVELYNRSGGAVDLSRYCLGGQIGFSFGWYGAVDFANRGVMTLESGATATWQADLSAGGAGDYEVLAWFSGDDGEEHVRDLDHEAQYTIAHAGGSSAVQIDQDGAAGVWVSLGTYAFGAGPASVTLTRTTDAPDRWTIADKIRFVKGPDEVLVDDAGAGFSTTGSAGGILAPGQYVVIAKDMAAFDEAYGAAGALAVGQYSGSLADTGGPVEVYEATTPQDSGYVPYVRVDHVRYDDEAPWPAEPTGTGASLNRAQAAQFGNDVINWAPSSLGTPGEANLDLDPTPPSVPAALGAAAVSDTRIDLTWQAADDPETWVDHYVIYRDGSPYGTSQSSAFSDIAAVETQTYSYRVSAVNVSGCESAACPAVTATPTPSVRSAFAYDLTHVTVTFGKPVEQASAETATNYAIVDSGGNPVAVASAALDVDPTKVVLTMAAAPQLDVMHTLSVSGVRDLAGNAVVGGSQTTFTPRHVDPTLIAWWTFDEGSGPVAPDATGNEHHLDIIGNVTWEPAGRNGGAMRFDGTAGSYLLDDDGEAYINALTAFTVATWIKSDAVNTSRGFFNSRNPGRYDCLNMRYDTSAWGGGANDTITAFISTSTGEGVLEGPADIQTTEWQHVALTWSGSGDLSLYVDGVPQSPTFTWGSPSGSVKNADRVIVGKGEQDSASSWLGLIDDVRIYSRVLDAQEIADLIASAPQDPPPAVTGFEANGGLERPSMLTAVAIQFSRDVSASLDAGDLAIHNDTTGADIDLAQAVFSYDAQTHTGHWDLAAVTVEPGFHTVSLAAAGVTNSDGLELDGNGDGDGGDDYANVVLVAAPGDANLDGLVDWHDYARARDAFAAPPAGWAGGDFNYDGQNDRLDYLALKAAFGTDLTPAPTAPAAQATTPATAQPADDPQAPAEPAPATEASLLSEAAASAGTPDAPTTGGRGLTTDGEPLTTPTLALAGDPAPAPPAPQPPNEPTAPAYNVAADPTAGIATPADAEQDILDALAVPDLLPLTL